MNAIVRAYWTAKGVGWDNLPRRLLQLYRIRTGWLRKRLSPDQFSPEAFAQACPAGPAEQRAFWKRRAGRFPAPAEAEALSGIADEAAWARHVTAPAEKALAGDYLFFSHWYGRLGWPPRFNHDPVNGVDWPVGRHWLLPGRPLHDIKLVWEPSRFSLAYLFARAYARSRQDKWAEAFWTMLDAWIEQNPPELSAAWACGQEMTFRLMAMLFAAMATLDSPAAGPERLHALSRLAWQTGRHISININQARMQGNNHAISEAVGLWTVGVLFPEFIPAAAWRRRGRDILAAEVERQIYDDGSFVQHSLNYHRVMTDDLLWALALARSAGEDLPPVVTDRLGRAADWLGQMIDPASGGVPNYGANDGANVLPLACCDYTDFRPTLQAAWRLLRGRRCFDPGPWDEKMLWLLGPESLDAAVVPPRRGPAFAARDGGYYVLRGANSWAMIRCHSYRDRPNHADMLHVDLWHKGVNVLCDGGSYSYNCPPPWRHYFLSTAAHNTVQIDGQDQMVKGPRFLWFLWTRSQLERFETSADGRKGSFCGRHSGYDRLAGKVVHRRSIQRDGDSYTIVDDILATDAGPHEVVLRWRLAPGPWRRDGDTWTGQVAGEEWGLTVAGSRAIECRLAAAEESPAVEGWESLYYGQKTPAPTVIVRASAGGNLRLVTLAGPGTPGRDQLDRLAEVCEETGP